MEVTIKVYAGNPRREPDKGDIQRNIDAIKRAATGKPECGDMVLYLDTVSILEGIQRKLPAALGGGGTFSCL
jgi:hypothetical protein